MPYDEDFERKYQLENPPLHQYRIKLACGHLVITHVKLNLQYPKDVHYISCPSCRTIAETLESWKPTPLLWNQVVSNTEIPYEHLSNVSRGIPHIMPPDIMRLQPSVPSNRKRIFPYLSK